FRSLPDRRAARGAFRAVRFAHPASKARADTAQGFQGRRGIRPLSGGRAPGGRGGGALTPPCPGRALLAVFFGKFGTHLAERLLSGWHLSLCGVLGSTQQRPVIRSGMASGTYSEAPSRLTASGC